MRLKREKYNKIEKISRYGEKIMHDIPKMILKPVFNPLTCPISQDQQAIFAVILAGIILLFTELRLISIAMFIIAIAYYIVIYMNCNATKYTITNDSITFSEGFINCIKSSVNIEDIKEVYLKQNFIQRILGLGTLRIYTSGSSLTGGIKLYDIKKSSKVYIEINKMVGNCFDNKEKKKISFVPDASSPYFSIFPAFCSLFIGCALGAVISVIWRYYKMNNLYQMATRGDYIIITLITAIFVMIVSILLYKFEIKAKKYFISADRVESKEGFFNYTYATIFIKNIREIRTFEGLIQRFFKLGTVQVVTPATSGIVEVETKNGRQRRAINFTNGIMFFCIPNFREAYGTLSNLIYYNLTKEKRDILKDRVIYGVKPTFSCLLQGIPALILFAMFMLIVLIIAVATGAKGSNFVNIILFGAIASILMTCIALFTVYMNYKQTKYNFHNDRIEFREGFIENKKCTIYYKDIREVSLSENFLQRMQSLGTIRLLTSGSNEEIESDSSGIRFTDIKNPKEVYEKIKNIITESRNNEIKTIKEDTRENTEFKTQITSKLKTVNKNIINKPQIKPSNGEKLKTLNPNTNFANIWLNGFMQTCGGSFFLGLYIFLTIIEKADSFILAAIVLLLFMTIIPFVLSIVVGLADLLNLKKTKYDLYEDKICYSQGFINNEYKTIEIKDIREVTYTKNIVQKMFNLGNIQLVTSANSLNGLKLMHIENPEKLYETLKYKTEYSTVSSDLKDESPLAEFQPTYDFMYVLFKSIIPSMILYVILMSILSLTMMLLFFIPALIITVASGIIVHKRTYYTVYNNKTEIMFDFIYHFERTIMNGKIREIHLKRSLLQRIFNLGTFILITAYSGNKGSRLFNIKNSEALDGFLKDVIKKQ